MSILNLDDDIFLMIFEVITLQIPDKYTVVKDRPLTVVQAASRVCRRWRGLLFTSPWIWGRVMDLHIDDCPSERLEWMEEVVRRAGASPLWIFGQVKSEGLRRKWDLFNKHSFLLKLFESWERVERLSIIIQGPTISNKIQQHFLSPAPNLKLFEVDLPDFQGPGPLFSKALLPSSSERLFGDYAPSLLQLSADKFGFKLDSPWLSNLRELHIPRMLGKQEVLVLLQHTPLLEGFKLFDPQNAQWDMVSIPFPRLNLPHLTSIYMKTNISAGASMLHHLSPPDRFSFHLDIVDSPALDLEALSSFKTNLPLFISSYFVSNCPTDILFMVTTKALKFGNLSAHDHNFYVNTGTMSCDQEHNNRIISCFLDSFRLSGDPSLFDSVTNIRLAVTNAQPSILPSIRSMLSALQQIQVIEITENFVPTLFSLCFLAGVKGDILFPKLHTVCLISVKNDPISTALTKFIEKRKDIGLPVVRLDLRGCERVVDLSALEAVDGLEICLNQT